MHKLAIEIVETGFYDFNYEKLARFFPQYEYYNVTDTPIQTYIIMIEWTDNYAEIIAENCFIKEGYQYCKLIISFYVTVDFGKMNIAFESLNTRKSDYKINISFASDLQRDFPTNQCYTTIIGTDNNNNALDDFILIKKWITALLFHEEKSETPRSL